ncbi:MAG: hypothetical protein WA584_12685 [Pyrinomonadaceae bacterium]
MKQCPRCKINYADDTLSFCLEDGTQLVGVPETQQPTVLFNDEEAQTVVRTPQAERVNVNLQETQAAQNRQQQPSQATQLKSQFQPQPAPKKSNTAMVVLLTAFVMLLLFGAGFGAWLFLNKNKGEVVQNKNVSNANKSNVNSNVKPTVSPSASATVTASPTPMPDFDPDDVKDEVSSTVNSWKSAAESHNLNAYMNNYADSIDYYNKGGASRSTVRADKQRAFSLYDSMDIDISNMRVTPSATGDTATAVFDKGWVFEGDEKYSEGKVQTQLQLVKSGGRWLISGEKDLKVYYTKK